MAEMENLFDENILVPSVKGAAFFILLYEHFEDVVINTVKDVYSIPCFLDGKMYYSIDDEYIKALSDKIENKEKAPFISYEHQLHRAREERDIYVNEIIRTSSMDDGKRFRGSLNWLKENGAFSETDVDRILQIRKRRNSIVHELLITLSNGLSEDDSKMMVELLAFNRRVNSWRFTEIDAPCLGYRMPEGATPDDVMGGDDTILLGIFRILFLDEGKQFKEALDELRQKYNSGKKNEE